MTDQNIRLIDARGGAVPATPTIFPEWGGAAPEEDNAFRVDVRAIWSAIYRNRLILFFCLILAVAAGIGVTMLTTPVYRAAASVQIEQQAPQVLGQEGGEVTPQAGLQDADRFLQTQLDILRSRSLAERVSESLKLDGNNRFLLAMGEEVSAATGSGLQSAAERKRRVAGVLQRNLEVNLPRDSRVADISFDSPDPVMAARIANSYADNFIISNLQRRYDASSYARNFLQNQLAEVKQKLEEAERQSIAYARSAQLVDTSGASANQSPGQSTARGGSLTTSSLIDINSALSQATAARIAAQQRWNQAQATPVMSLPEVQANSTIQQLLSQRSQRQAQYEEDRVRRKEDFPAMRQQQAQIEALDRQILQLANQAKISIRDQYQIAARQEQALRGNIAQLRGQTLAEQDRGVQLNILRREVDTTRTMYEGLLQRYKEVSAAAGITANNISVIDRAETPTAPILPRPAINLALALIAGLGVALMLIFLRETFDDAIRSADDVDTKLGVSFLGSIPVLDQGEPPIEALRSQRSAFSEAHYALRGSLSFATATGLPRCIVTTSSQQGEGKSTTSVGIARSFAGIGYRVLLIDSDLRKPSLHKILNAPSQPGFSNILVNQATIDQVKQTTEFPNLDFIPSGPLPPNPAELLASASLKELIASLTKQYDLVVIDGPPVMGLADAPLLSAVIDGTVFVIEAGRAHRGQAKIALRRLKEAHGVILGAVLNKFDARQIGYGADYGYGYSYGETKAPRQARLGNLFGLLGTSKKDSGSAE